MASSHVVPGESMASSHVVPAFVRHSRASFAVD
jgi:hypothetical protein